jgi:hypothetical protein
MGITGPVGVVVVGFCTTGVNPGMLVSLVGFCERQPAPITRPMTSNAATVSLSFFIDSSLLVVV